MCMTGVCGGCAAMAGDVGDRLGCFASATDGVDPRVGATIRGRNSMSPCSFFEVRHLAITIVLFDGGQE